MVVSATPPAPALSEEEESDDYDEDAAVLATSSTTASPVCSFFSDSFNDASVIKLNFDWSSLQL